MLDALNSVEVHAGRCLVRAGRDAPCDRRGRADRRAPGAKRPLHPARMARLCGRGRGKPRPGLGRRASVRRPLGARDRCGPAARRCTCSSPRPTASSAPSGSRRRPRPTLDRGFAILVFTEGAAELHSEHGEPMRVASRRHRPCPVGRGSLPARRRGRRGGLPTARRGSGRLCVTDLLLGIDVGTSACKAVVVDRDRPGARPRPIGHALAARAHGGGGRPRRPVRGGGRRGPRRAGRRAGGAGARRRRDEHGGGRCAAGRPRPPARAGDRVARRPRRRGGAPLAERPRRRPLRRVDRPARQPAVLAGEAALAGRAPPRDAVRGALAERGRVGRAPTRRAGRGRAVARLANRAARPVRARAVQRCARLGRPARRPAGRARDRRHARGTAAAPELPECQGAVLTVAGHDHLVAGRRRRAWWHRATCSTPAAPPRRSCESSPRRSNGEQVRRSVAGGVTVGWHLAAGRQALLGSVWSGLALRGGPRRARRRRGRPREAVRAGALAADAGDAPALELELHSLDRRPLQLPAGVGPERDLARRDRRRARGGRGRARAHRDRRRAPAEGRRRRRLGSRRGGAARPRRPWAPSRLRRSSRPAPAGPHCSAAWPRASSRASTPSHPSRSRSRPEGADTDG